MGQRLIESLTAVTLAVIDGSVPVQSGAGEVGDGVRGQIASRVVNLVEQLLGDDGDGDASAGAGEFDDRRRCVGADLGDREPELAEVWDSLRVTRAGRFYDSVATDSTCLDSGITTMNTDLPNDSVGVHWATFDTPETAPPR